ncbi:hypothetical protein Tco_0636768 [Tanacetum coccineum]
MADAKKTTTLKIDVYKKAHNALLLCLDNKVLRKVNKEDSAMGVWLNWSVTWRTIDLRLDDEESGTHVYYVHYHLHMMNFVRPLLYEEESSRARKMSCLPQFHGVEKRIDANDDGDGLYLRGRSDHQGNQGRSSLRSKSKGKGTYKLKCYICNLRITKEDCPNRNKKKSTALSTECGQGSGTHSEGCARITPSGKKLSEHIHMFNKLIGDLANIDVDIDDEDQALMLLTSLPSSYDNFVETFLYGRESLTWRCYDNGDLLMAVSRRRFLEWIMDSGGSLSHDA